MRGVYDHLVSDTGGPFIIYLFEIDGKSDLFLAGGLIYENSFLIKGGIFILILKALIDAHFIISKYQRNKSISFLSTNKYGLHPCNIRSK